MLDIAGGACSARLCRSSLGLDPFQGIMGADHGDAGMQVDMSNEGQVAAMVAAASRSLPQLSIFVNNAAVFVLKSVTEASEAGGCTCQPSCVL